MLNEDRIPCYLVPGESHGIWESVTWSVYFPRSSFWSNVISWWLLFSLLNYSSATARTTFNKIPGSAILLRYARSSHRSFVDRSKSLWSLIFSADSRICESLFMNSPIVSRLSHRMFVLNIGCRCGDPGQWCKPHSSCYFGFCRTEICEDPPTGYSWGDAYSFRRQRNPIGFSLVYCPEHLVY